MNLNDIYIKNKKMKKLFTLLLLLCCSVTFAQQSQDTLRLKHFSTWAVAPYLSLPFQYTDIEPISLSAKLTGAGINVEKHLSHYTSFQLGYFNTTMYNKKDGLNYRMELSQWDARFYVHITNGNTLRTWRNTQLYVYGGVGRLGHKSTIKNDTTAETVKFVDGKAMALQFGGGAKYRIGNRTSLFIDGCANFTSSDRIDATIERWTNNDGYFKLSAGISYTLGKKKMIEWDNPYQYLVPEEVHDTTVVIKTIKYEAPKVEEVKVDSTTIYYLTGSSSIEAPYLDQLDKLVDRANANGYGIQVLSYCDATGTSKANAELVKSRADNVVKYLSKSFDVNHIMINTFDESAAVYAPEARNRRVVVKLIK